MQKSGNSLRLLPQVPESFELFDLGVAEEKTVEELCRDILEFKEEDPDVILQKLVEKGTVPKAIASVLREKLEIMIGSNKNLFIKAKDIAIKEDLKESKNQTVVELVETVRENIFSFLEEHQEKISKTMDVFENTEEILSLLSIIFDDGELKSLSNEVLVESGDALNLLQEEGRKRISEEVVRRVVVEAIKQGWGNDEGIYILKRNIVCISNNKNKKDLEKLLGKMFPNIYFRINLKLSNRSGDSIYSIEFDCKID